MYDAHQIANYFLAQCDRDEGEIISNLKLQKLLYYAQGFNLALNDERLFREDVEAWTHGPVVPRVYHAFKRFGNEALPSPEGFDMASLDEGSRDLLDEIFQVYGQYSAWKLANMTHIEPPWKSAIERGQSTVITDDSMREYFKTLIE